MDPSVNAASSWLIRTILPVLFLLLAASKFMAHLLDIKKPTSCLGLQELPASIAVGSRACCWIGRMLCARIRRVQHCRGFCNTTDFGE